MDNINDKFIESLKTGDLNAITELLDRDIDAETLENALIDSARQGQTNLVQLLLKYNVNVHTCAQNDAALRFSVLNGHVAIVIELLKNGANVRADSDIVLQFGIINNDEPMIATLLKHGANVHFKNDYALRWSIIFGYTKMCAILLEHGANIYCNDCEILKKIMKDANTDEVNANASVGMFSMDYGMFYSSSQFVIAAPKPAPVQVYFDQQLASMLFPYCSSDDYKYFPSDYIQTKFVSTKSAHKN